MTRTPKFEDNVAEGLKIGDRVRIKSAFGSGPTVVGTITGFGTKNDRPLIDYNTRGTSEPEHDPENIYNSASIRQSIEEDRT